MSDMRNQVFTLRITVLTPVHIGAGRRLVANLDFYSADDATWVLDSDVALDLALRRWEERQPTLEERRRQLDEEEERLKRRIELNKQQIREFDERPPRDPQQRQQREQRLRQEAGAIREKQAELARRRAELEAGDGAARLEAPDILLKSSGFADLIKADLLTLDDLRNGVMWEGRPLVRYRLTASTGAEEIYEQIKDAADRPYLPGASLKGAIRSALLWDATGDMELFDHIGDNRERADDAIERRVFLGKPGRPRMNNTLRDVLRTLHIGDSAPIDVSPMLLEVAIFNSASKKQARLAVEALPPGAELRATMQIERYPFVNREAREALDFGAWGERLAPAALAAACRRRAAALIAGERAFFAKQSGGAEIERFYTELEGRLRGLEPEAFLLPVGWGAGWRSKTLDTRLHVEGQVNARFAEVVRRFELKADKSRSFRPGGLFPQTRKVVMAGGRPWRPLGWVVVSVV